MIHYDTDFIVKYKDIEVELATISTSPQEDQETILDEVYRHEILSVFQSDNIVDEKIGQTLMGLFEQLKNYPSFTDIVQRYKRVCFFEGCDDLTAFTALFSYDTLYLVHPCICAFLLTDAIPPILLDPLSKYIDKMEELPTNAC